MSYTITGKIHKIFDSIVISGNFTKREFVLWTAENPQYPQYVKFQMSKNQIGLLDQFQSNDEVEVSFNIRGREWNNPKGGIDYFNTMECFKIQRVGQFGNSNNRNQSNDYSAVKSNSNSREFSESKEDLPF